MGWSTINTKKLLKEWILPILSTFILIMIIRNYVFFTAVIPSESMFPTLQVSDRLITSRIFSKKNLTRGELIIFKGNIEGHNHMHVKRLIGLPGDKILLKENGDVYVNGTLLDEPYVLNQIDIAEHVHHEHSDCSDHDTHKMKLGNFEVPDGELFFLGDNRSASFDSRYWDSPYISMDQVVGKPLIRLWPLNKFGSIK